MLLSALFFCMFCMDIFLQDMVSYLLLYKYGALFLVTFLAAFALPLPSTTSLVAAAGFASQGYLDIGLVILWAILGNVVADNLLYWTARFFGMSVFRVRITESSLFHFIVNHLQKQSKRVIFWSRFQVITTLAVNVLSGMTQINYRKFFLYGLYGETAQVLIFSAIGYFFGSQLTGIASILGNFTTALLIGIVLIIVLFWKSLIAYFNKQSR